jgi:Raf kinase inhibitor-like YbhB/YbcL family protein
MAWTGKKRLIWIAAAAAAVAAVVMAETHSASQSSMPVASQNTMKLESEAFGNDGNIPEQYSCYGKAEAIPLIVSGVPDGTKSLAIVADDPDAPNGDFVHWVIWNINPETAAFATDNPPGGSVEGITSLGKSGFVAPCPPSGTHHYRFKLYALDNELAIPASSDRSALMSAIEGHVLSSTMLTGLYEKKN